MVKKSEWKVPSTSLAKRRAADGEGEKETHEYAWRRLPRRSSPERKAKKILLVINLRCIQTFIKLRLKCINSNVLLFFFFRDLVKHWICSADPRLLFWNCFRRVKNLFPFDVVPLFLVSVSCFFFRNNFSKLVLWNSACVVFLQQDIREYFFFSFFWSGLSFIPSHVCCSEQFIFLFLVRDYVLRVSGFSFNTESKSLREWKTVFVTHCALYWLDPSRVLWFMRYFFHFCCISSSLCWLYLDVLGTVA